MWSGDKQIFSQSLMFYLLVPALSLNDFASLWCERAIHSQNVVLIRSANCDLLTGKPTFRPFYLKTQTVFPHFKQEPPILPVFGPCTNSSAMLVGLGHKYYNTYTPRLLLPLRRGQSEVLISSQWWTATKFIFSSSVQYVHFWGTCTWESKLMSTL